MIKGAHFPRDIILNAMRYYIAYKLSYRDIEEILLERRISVDHATINRWVLKYISILESKIINKKKPVSTSWRHCLFSIN
ncbi:transposase (fragment) [Moritella yayanosii]|uniref:Transposase n=1 Tax=Moritella yayanosii TaxID=69539 RepID=A0A330LQM5_9GAMM